MISRYHSNHAMDNIKLNVKLINTETVPNPNIYDETGEMKACQFDNVLIEQQLMRAVFSFEYIWQNSSVMQHGHEFSVHQRNFRLQLL